MTSPWRKVVTNPMPKFVFIVSDHPREYSNMFVEEGWIVTNKISATDLIQFTGGEDVTPSLYNEIPHSRTSCNPHRDQKEAIIFQIAKGKGIPMAGICRGGQFLNVMCGGRLWQDVNGHAITGTHKATCSITGQILDVTSTHHQMMRPSDEGLVALVAKTSYKKERMSNAGHIVSIFNDEPDVEACWYPKDDAFCFQPHPEFVGYEKLRHWYFAYLDYFLFDGDEKSLKENMSVNIAAVGG